MRTQSKETQSHLTPDLAIQILKDGNERFVKNLKTNRNLLQQVNETSSGQFPFATILSCIDSRTSAELVFDQGLGDIFSIRIAGNILNEDILGSMEFATKVSGSKVIVVLGHTKCGAIVGACNHVEMGNLTTLLNKIQPAIYNEKTITTNRNGSNQDFVQKVTELNVNLTIDRIRRESPIIADLESAGQIKIIGGIYDVENGKVTFYE
jgi:carbonic anhydrase